MATITGKRFQMTDGAATPVNLFPYTVSEAVYGLNNSISNAISSALSTISLSTYAGTSAIGSSTQPVYYDGSALVATDLSTTYAPYNAAGYLPLTGGTITGSGDTPLTINSTQANTVAFNIRLNNSVKSELGYAAGSGSSNLGTYIYDYPTGRYISISTNGTPTFTGNTIYHSGNSNNRAVAWTCSTLTLAGTINGVTNIAFPDISNAKSFITNYYNGGTYAIIHDHYASGNISINACGGDIYFGYWNTIGYHFYTSGNERVTIDSSGNVGIGTTSPSQALHVVGNILSTGDQIINSDLTLKTNLKDVTYSVSDIAKCRAVTFDWKDGHGHSAGSIAQDWKPLIPELVHGEEGGMTLAYGQIALVNSILEAREIERLKERVAELENQLRLN